jgi:hypothetical protein
MISVAMAMLLVGAPPGSSVTPAFSIEVTECDRLAAHPDDPLKVAPGVSDTVMDKPAAIRACSSAVSADPSNPRLNYQLARALGYSGRGAEAIPYRNRAVSGNYPQALFVVGYITMLGLNDQPKDVCRGAELIRRSAIAGRLAGQVGYVHWALGGHFDKGRMKLHKQEMHEFLKAAKLNAKSDFYIGLLIDGLQARLERHAF